MISKEKFCKYMEQIKEMNNKNSDLYALGVEIESLSDCIYISSDILKDVFDDESDWIDYFMFDLDFGVSYEDGDILDKDGNNISMKNAEELYDILIENMK